MASGIYDIITVGGILGGSTLEEVLLAFMFQPLFPPRCAAADHALIPLSLLSALPAEQPLVIRLLTDV